MRPLPRRFRPLALRLGTLLAVALVPSLASSAGSGLADSGGRLAYVDPGSGSFILQALVATAAGAAVAVNAYWGRIKRMFGRGAPEEDEDATSAPPSDD